MIAMDDQLLWNLFRKEDNELAFTQLSQRYYSILRHYGTKFTTHVPIIEDSIQEVYIRLWLQRKNISDTVSVKYYLLKSFRHQLFVNFRKKNLYVPLQEEHEESYTHFVGSSIEDGYIMNESNQLFSTQLQGILSQLPPRQREIIYLRYYQNLSLDEIAQLFSINTQSVANNIQRALHKLRTIWPETLLQSTPFVLAIRTILN